MRDSFELEFAFTRDQLISANDRLHWRARNRRTRYLRGLANDMARARRAPSYGAAQIVAWVTWPNHARRDVHNLMPTLKALVDGLVDARVLPDDSDRHLIGPDPRATAGVTAPWGPLRVPVYRVVLRITDLGEEVTTCPTTTTAPSGATPAEE